MENQETYNAGQPRTMPEIAMLLAEQYNQKSQCAIALSHCDLDYDARLLAITPVEGWTGKNAEERKLASERAAAADLALSEIAKTRLANQDALAVIGATIDSLEAERRALEWGIRGILAQALAGLRESNLPVEDGAFDDAAQEYATHAAVVDLTDEIPF